jgi:CDP-4-dehydro-6-deoxyglucose reductase
LLSGKTKKLHDEDGLQEDLSNDGWILPCARAALTDLELDAECLVLNNFLAPQMWPCRIFSLVLIAPDVMQVMLRFPESADFKFLPGQFIDLTVPGNVTRSYSIAGFEDRLLELHVRHVKNGALSKYLFDRAIVGDLLRIKGPLGGFVLRETGGVDLVFLATGTGIAPIKAMLSSLNKLSANAKPRSILLVWGGRVTTDLYLNVPYGMTTCEYIPVLSQNHDNWDGALGYVQDILLSRKSVFDNTSVYAAGSLKMINSARSQLINNGLSKHHFYSDAFICTGTEEK